MLKQKIKGILALTRWRENLLTTFVLTSVGIAVTNEGYLGIKAIALLVANVFGMFFTYVINDVEDADDDAMDERKAKRNPISNGTLTKQEGYIITAWFFVVSALLYLVVALSISNALVFVFGISILIVGFLYSSKKVRLKSMPILDIFSHAYMLALGEFLTAYFAFSTNLSPQALYMGLAIYIISIHGDFENENRDYVVDKKTGIHNTVQLINNLNISRLIQYVILGLFIVAVILIGASFINRFSFEVLMAKTAYYVGGYFLCVALSALIYWLIIWIKNERLKLTGMLVFSSQMAVVLLMNVVIMRVI